MYAHTDIEHNASYGHTYIDHTGCIHMIACQKITDNYFVIFYNFPLPE